MKKPIDIDALVAEAVPPRPNPQLAFTMPVRVDSERNRRGGWKWEWARGKKQKEEVWVAWPRKSHLFVPCVVRLIRVGPKSLDSDNLAESFKAIRDAIAQEMGMDDGNPLVTWEYEQVAVGKRVYQVRVEVY